MFVDHAAASGEKLKSNAYLWGWSNGLWLPRLREVPEASYRTVASTLCSAARCPISAFFSALILRYILLTAFVPAADGWSTAAISVFAADIEDEGLLSEVLLVDQVAWSWIVSIHLLEVLKESHLLHRQCVASSNLKWINVKIFVEIILRTVPNLQNSQN